VCVRLGPVQVLLREPMLRRMGLDRATREHLGRLAADFVTTYRLAEHARPQPSAETVEAP